MHHDVTQAARSNTNSTKQHKQHEATHAPRRNTSSTKQHKQHKATQTARSKTHITKQHKQHEATRTARSNTDSMKQHKQHGTTSAARGRTSRSKGNTVISLTQLPSIFEITESGYIVNQSGQSLISLNSQLQLIDNTGQTCIATKWGILEKISPLPHCLGSFESTFVNTKQKLCPLR